MPSSLNFDQAFRACQKHNTLAYLPGVSAAKKNDIRLPPEVDERAHSGCSLLGEYQRCPIKNIFSVDF
jgi:hypothetical protein